jgi:cell volume regulation protein A
MELDPPGFTALAMTVGGLLLAASCLMSRVGARLGVPVSLMFLGVGMAAGCDGPGGIEFDDFSLSYAAGTVALAAVLFAGGLQTHVHTLRGAVAPASVLATVGVLGIASLTALGGHWFGLPWKEAWLVGAIVASTDASAVFGVLQGMALPQRVSRTIELESGLNDPVAVILTIAMTSQMLGEPASISSLAWQAAYQLVVGAAFGVVVGWLAQMLLARVQLPSPALTPVLTLGCALVAFGAPAALGGSGFLAAYLAGMMVGNSPAAQRSHLVCVHDSLSWLSQVSMFLLLGLLVNPSELPHVMWMGLLLALFLAFVARPLTVYLCLLPFRFPWRERLFISWVGLRGAVPIILATLPVLQSEGASPHMVEALDVFDIVFFVVVVSAIVPGATVKPLARWLKLDETTAAAPSPGIPAATHSPSIAEQPVVAG